MTNSGNQISVFHRSVFAMNTHLDVVFCGLEKHVFENAFQQISSEVESIELTLSRYNPDSELFKLNQLATNKPVPISRKLMDTIELAAAYYEATNGFFDVSLGSVFHHLKSGENQNHTTTERFSDRVFIDSANQTVQFLQPDVSLDFGGIGKGFAIKSISKIIDNHQIENAFISFGGSSILTRGHHPHGNYWPFTLAEHQEHVWKLNNDCLSVSCSHRKVSGKNAAHIVNPFSSEIRTSEKTVVVQIPNPVDAEVLSTALIAAPETEHAKILDYFKPVNYIIF